MNEVGDELHYIFRCNYFHESRKKYLPIDIQYYAIESNTHKLFGMDEVSLLNPSRFPKIIMTHFKQCKKNLVNKEIVTTIIGRTVLPPNRLNL